MVLWLSELKICFIFLAATIRYEFCSFVSRNFMALSVSTRRLVLYVLVVSPYCTACCGLVGPFLPW
jgi:hypothetical protein